MASKGNVTMFAIFAVVFMVMMGITYIIASMLLNDFNDEIQASDDFGAIAKNTTQTLTTQSTSVFDGAVLFLFIGCWLGMLISAWYMEANPLFFIVSIILIVMVVWVAMILGNTYEEIIADDALSTFADDFPKTNFLIENIVVMIISMTFTTLITLYGRSVI